MNERPYDIDKMSDLEVSGALHDILVKENARDQMLARHHNIGRCVFGGVTLAPVVLLAVETVTQDFNIPVLALGAVTSIFFAKKASTAHNKYQKIKEKISIKSQIAEREAPFAKRNSFHIVD